MTAADDRAREEIAERFWNLLPATPYGWHAVPDSDRALWLRFADAVRALMAEAAAKALEDAADELPRDDGLGLVGDWELLDRARALTTAHDEESRDA